MMLHVVGGHGLVDVYMPRLFMQALANVACHWQTSLSRYTHSTSVRVSLGYSCMPNVA